MPMVGKKKFPYTKKGKAAAKKYAKKSEIRNWLPLRIEKMN